MEFDAVLRRAREAVRSLQKLPGAARVTQAVARLQASHWLKKRPPVRARYINLRSPARIATKLIFPLILGVIGLAYGFYFALTVPYLLVPFAVPAILLIVLCIWALPSRATAPKKSMEFTFAALMIIVVLWPNYLALALPGLPWITMIRLSGFPMAFLLLVCLSSSESMRADLVAIARKAPVLWTLFFAFTIIQFLSMPISKTPAASFQRALIHQITWTAVVVVAAYVGRRPGRPQFYMNLLMVLGLVMAVIGILEFGEKGVLWRSDVPEFLKIEDPIVVTMLSGARRGATGLYRIKATFSTALGMAEFMALLTPMAIHYAVTGHRFLVRLSGLLYLPLIYYVVRLTDARLGVVGFLVSFAAYLLIWGLLRYRRTAGDLFSSVIVYGYPAVIAVAVVALNTVGRVATIVLGGGATTASDAARERQLAMGAPKILGNPFGHGAGGAGKAMGYGEGQFVAIDNYYLLLGLSYGVLGITAFLALFGSAIFYTGRATLRSAHTDDRELSLLVPLTATFPAFLIMKWVFAQEDGHPLVFMMLGLAMALVSRAHDLAPVRARHTVKPAPTFGLTAGVLSHPKTYNNSEN